MKKSNPAEDIATKVETFDPLVVEAKFKKWFPDLNPATISSLVLFQSELLTTNKTLSLIANATLKNAESFHIADGVFSSRLISKALVPNADVYDFSAGNGVPGIILALLNPTRRIIIVGREQRKMEFCRHVAGAMKLQNVSVLVKGVEELPEKSVTNAVARGFAPFAKALLICRKQLPKGGRFFHVKSDGWATELAQLPSQIFSHWTPSLLGQYRLPDTTSDMFVVQTEKLSD